MHGSHVCRGIRGLFPLIREHCPQAISLPSRYDGIRGKRIAIDATLLVQRLWFAPDTHEKRHLIGLYRLLQTLKAQDVTPIMVFDHLQARLPQKERERERRRIAKSLHRSRASLERRRSWRLQELDSILREMQLFEEEEKQRVKSLFVGSLQQDEPLLEDIEQDILERDPQETDWDALLHASILSRLDESEELLDRLAEQEHISLATPSSWEIISEAQGSSIETAAQRLILLKRSFDSEADHLKETPTQAKLTALEADIYDALASTRDPSAVLTGATDREILITKALEEATEKNTALSQHYARHSTSTTPDLFESSAALCSTLDVPVLWTGSGERSGPFAGKAHEGEAVASMLVTHGWADLVASEDSDVILYDAPLLRGLLGVKTRMEIIDSKLVRQTFFPGDEGESRSKMLEFALLAGTDYNRTLPGIAARTALKLVAEHGSIVGILRKFGKKYSPPDGLTWQAYKRELSAARDVFRKPPSIRRYLPLLRQVRSKDTSQAEMFLSRQGINGNDLTTSLGFGQDFFGEGQALYDTAKTS